MTDWAPVAIAGLGIAGTLGGTLFGVRLNQGAEDRRWNAAQRAAFATARAERLRKIYARLAQSAVSLEAVIRERGYMVGDETVEQRDDRHNRHIQEAISRVAELGGEILVEASAGDVRSAYDRLVNASRRYLTSEHLPAGTERARQLDDLGADVARLAGEVVEQAQRHLETLERPPEV